MLADHPWCRRAPDRIVMGAGCHRRFRVNTALTAKVLASPDSGKGDSGPAAGAAGQAVPGPGQFQDHTFRQNRRITLPRGRPDLVVEDLVSGNSDAVLIWNLGPDVAAWRRLDSDGPDAWRRFEWELTTRKRRKFKLTVDIDGELAPGEVSLHIKRGGTSPVFGWYASQFMQKVPATVIVLWLKKRSDVWVTTRVEKIR
jgi:hypothetical protein